MDPTGFVLFGLLYLILLAFAIWGGYWLQRLAVRHALKDHLELLDARDAERDRRLARAQAADHRAPRTGVTDREQPFVPESEPASPADSREQWAAEQRRRRQRLEELGRGD